MQLKVRKVDASIEKYAHTKVFGSLNNALVLIDQPNVFAAEQFAEAITYYFYNEKRQEVIATDEIHLMIQSVLNATGYQNAAGAINEHRIMRKINRDRIEICQENMGPLKWNKTVIVNMLMNKDGLDRAISRAIASSVEEKVLNMGITRLNKNLLRELVINERKAMIRAEEQLGLVG